MAEDKSRKGEIDSPIRDMIDEINIDPKMSTTSSCSGRIVVYQKLENIRKTNCNWLLVLHEPINLEQLQDSLRNVTTGGIVFAKFEPFILHCQCADMETARCLYLDQLVSLLNQRMQVTAERRDKFLTEFRNRFRSSKEQLEYSVQ
uniref:tRNA wybutosine-synthesizing protein 3 homolog n=1 Tax=Macrostomum lignano TaxID=282301 RepID=A0A1I8J7G7_9PLAT